MDIKDLMHKKTQIKSLIISQLTIQIFIKKIHDSCFLYLVNYLIERHSPNFSEVPF